jgi:hypothetical protein
MTTDIDISNKQRGQAIIEYVSAAAAYVTGGWSEAVALPIRRYIEKHLKELEEVLIEEMRSGLVDETTLIEEDRLAAFVLRVRRAALEGTAKRKLRIMARYFFRTAPSPNFSSDAMADFFDVTERLTDTDMRCLAMLKRAQQAEPIVPGSGGYLVRTIQVRAELRPDFPTELLFFQAVFALSRFGLVYGGPMADDSPVNVSERGLDYLNNLDFDCLDLG